MSLTRRFTSCSCCSGLGSGSSFDKSGSVGAERVTCLPYRFMSGKCGLVVGDIIKRRFGMYGGVVDEFQGQDGTDSNGSIVNVFVSS